MPRFEAYSPERTRALVEVYGAADGPLLPILHAVQHAFGHVPEAAIPVIAEALNLSRAEVWGVVTFYHDFRSAPAGDHVLKICRAEACQVRGGEAVVAYAEQRLGLSCGDTASDGSVTLQPIYCLGLCASGPVALVDGTPIARLDAAAIDRIVGELGL